jgi:cytochrome c biogenesis factor
MRILFGLLLGLVLAALLPVIQALLEALRVSPRDDSYFHAFAITVLVLLSMLVVRRPMARRRPEPSFELREPAANRRVE